jgi:hypothetical protein
VHARDAPQPLNRVVHPGDVLAPFGDRLAHRALEDGDQEIVLASEIEINGSSRDAG